MAGTESLLQSYLTRSVRTDGAPLDPTAAAFYASLDAVGTTSPRIAGSIIRELRDQRTNLKLIASENYCSLTTQLAHGNLLTDKYSEGFPGHRFYAGCDNVDEIETEATELACELFGADHAYVQPHSGADANLVAYLAALSGRVEAPLLQELQESDPTKLDQGQWSRVRGAMHSQRLLALDYYSGGHLTHGYRRNVSSQLFDAHHYGVDPVSKLLDLDQLRDRLHEVRPFLFLAGYSAYPRRLNFAKMREMADEVGAIFMVDMAHFAGLVAGKVFAGDYDPVAHAHIVTSTTHKTLRGPRGGLVLCKKEFKEWVDKGCPAVLGGPLPHAMAAKAVAFREALSPEFRDYAGRIVENARALAGACLEASIPVLTGGSDNHMILVDVAEGFGLTGRQAESALRESSLTLNRNALPFDENGPWYTSGLRVGTSAATTLGMSAPEMEEIAAVLKLVLSNVSPAAVSEGPRSGQPSRARYRIEPKARTEARRRVGELLGRYPLYPQIDMDLLLASSYVQ